MIVLLTLASHFGQYLYLELSTHFRLQYLLGSFLCVPVFTAYQSWKFLSVALFCGLLNLVYIWPYYRGRSKQNHSAGVRFRLLVANVLKNNKNYASIFRLIKQVDPDVVVLQETGEAWRDQIKLLNDDYPFSEIALRPKGAGTVILSKHKFEKVDVLTLDASIHVAILAEVRFDHHQVTILALHPTTPISPFKFKNRNLQFREAAALLKSVDGPGVLVGDLNTTMWSPYFSELLRSANLRDARLGFGLKTTWPMPLPSFLRMPIDHCLVSRELHVANLEIGRHIGSDHRPVIADLLLTSHFPDLI
jgi:endonuclease/exonuclease/phosphatase (EEP) superfamily protein YafD